MGYTSRLDFLIKTNITIRAQLLDQIAQLEKPVNPINSGPVTGPESGSDTPTDGPATISNGGSGVPKLSTTQITALDLANASNYTTLVQQYTTNKDAVLSRMQSQYEALNAKISQAEADSEALSSDVEVAIDAYNSAAATLDPAGEKIPVIE